MIDQKLGIGALRQAKVLYEGDLYELASVLLRMYDAREEQTRGKARPTVMGLVKNYAFLMDLDFEAAVSSVKHQGLPLDAVVDYDGPEAV